MPALPTIGATEYVAALVERDAFHCPFCQVYTTQRWKRLQVEVSATTIHGMPTDVYRSTCSNCHKHTYWLKSDAETVFQATLLWPVSSPLAPLPHTDMPEDARALYEEARGILERSPRGATALLRVAAEHLLVDLGQGGKKMDDAIAALVRDGLPVRVQQAFDSLRITGNDAVHPGQINDEDNRDTAGAMFGLLNYIVEQRITQPKELDAIYGTLDESKRQRIEQRDGSVAPSDDATVIE